MTNPGHLAPVRQPGRIPPPIPEALHPWQELFARMPPAHLKVLARLMADLQPLIEEPERTVPQQNGEFDSYDGIAARGEIDRLLMSEWLWFDLDRQEFLRRFAENELLYHRVRHRQPSENRAIGVLVDCGPWMLGAPRLVALAALLCLGHRAHRDRLPIFWRSNADTQANVWNGGFGFDAVYDYLRGVAAKDFAPEDLVSCMTAPPQPIGSSRKKSPQTHWYVIGPRQLTFPDAPMQATQIVVAERAALGPDGSFTLKAEVTLIAPFRRPHSLTLALPPEDKATALLRDPFPRPRSKPLPVRQAQHQSPEDWALRHVAVTSNNLVLVRQPDGILALNFRKMAASYFLPLRSFERLAGIRADEEGLMVAIVKRYLDFSRLTVVHYPDFGEGEQLGELQLDKDTASAISAHAPEVLPILARPGKKPLCWVYGTDKTAYEISCTVVQRYRMLSGTDIIQCLSDHVLVRRSDGRLSLRPMKASNRNVTFDIRLGPQDRPGRSDLIVNPAAQVLALKNDGCWQLRNGAGLLPYAPSIERDGLLSISGWVNKPQDPLITYYDHHGALYSDTFTANLDDRETCPIAGGEFHPHKALHSMHSRYPVFVECGADGYAVKLLRRTVGTADDDWQIIDVKAEMTRAKCLRD